MIIFGICVTPAADISGHILLRDAINCSQRDVPLYFEHKHRIGTVTRLNYAGDRLYIHAETDDADALRLGYFSPAGKPLERIQSGRLWHVSKFRLDEVSLVAIPKNKSCVVIERRQTDPMHEYIKARARHADLLVQYRENPSVNAGVTRMKFPTDLWHMKVDRDWSALPPRATAILRSWSTRSTNSI